MKRTKICDLKIPFFFLRIENKTVFYYQMCFPFVIIIIIIIIVLENIKLFSKTIAKHALWFFEGKYQMGVMQYGFSGLSLY